ncbi:heme-binding protein [Frankia sp. AiPs1]|uniref:heme-binding protein n=1 Tax=Frankia sp. AiPs1 TaxID=573493 RepID=UPI0020448442|nr:heme-binding protein [Frankia sp. AiPs1]MCM3924230.1 heme-binding protein [Frankia sp. AiPs1]
MTVSLEDARRIIAAGERYAIHLGQPVNIAVVDYAGILVAHVRMGNARLQTADISVDRACAARVSAAPARLVSHTGGEGGPAVAGDEGYGGWERPPAEPGAGLTGALPLRRDGTIVGAVGVSGGPAPLDEAIARAAAAAF